MDELNRDRLQKEQLVQDLRAQEIALLEDNEELRRLLNEERKGIPKTVLATKGRLGMVRAYEADFNEQISSHATVPYRHDIEYMGQRTCKSIWDCKDLPFRSKVMYTSSLCDCMDMSKLMRRGYTMAANLKSE